LGRLFSVTWVHRFLIVLFATTAVARAAIEPLLPTGDGTTWLYEMTEEAGPGFSFSDANAAVEGKIHRLTLYRLSGTQDLNTRTLLKFEMLRDSVITNTDLMIVNEHGIFCAARIDAYGKVTALDPPQPIVVAPFEPGVGWDFVSKVGGAQVRQHYQILAAEDVDVPAGRFRAFHIRGMQTEPVSMTVDRWFVPGTGIVKDVTVTKTPEGNLVRRISLALKEPPKIAPRPEVKSPSSPKKVSLTLGKAARGTATDQFPADTPKIYARWQGHDLPLGAKIRVVWIAENVADVAPPDYIIDEASASANNPDAYGTFTLSRPDDGWAPGDYRVDVYLDAKLIDSAKLKITK
jgi:hypothetical protein